MKSSSLIIGKEVSSDPWEVALEAEEAAVGIDLGGLPWVQWMKERA